MPCRVRQGKRARVMLYAFPQIALTPENGDRAQQPMENAKVAARIRQAMEDRGIKQAELARAIGVGPTTMWKYLTGRLGVSRQLIPIARALKVDPDWLAGAGDGEPQDEHTEVIESFIRDIGPGLRPPLTNEEAGYVRGWPHHRVTHGALLDAVQLARRGLTAEEAAHSVEVTEAARRRGEALGVKPRKPR
jgi:transcriptional regulator with XRE-family HTH domain